MTIDRTPKRVPLTRRVAGALANACACVGVHAIGCSLIAAGFLGALALCGWLDQRDPVAALAWFFELIR